MENSRTELLGLFLPPIVETNPRLDAVPADDGLDLLLEMSRLRRAVDDRILSEGGGEAFLENKKPVR